MIYITVHLGVARCLLVLTGDNTPQFWDLLNSLDNLISENVISKSFFWHRAQEIAVFTTLTGLDSCLVMPFGLHNAQFNWFMNKMFFRAKCVRALLNCLAKHLTAILTKCECAKATVTRRGESIQTNILN